VKAAAKGSSRLSILGLAVVLASILAFLYVRTQGRDDSSYFENVALLRQLKQLDARWELDAIKSKMGINTNYDSLVDPLLDLNQLRERLQTELSSQTHVGGRALVDGTEAFRQAVQEKTRLIEHFKSHNSVLRNSLAFLPTAADDIQKAMEKMTGADQSAKKRVLVGVNDALLGILVYSQAPSDEKTADTQLQLDHLAEYQAGLPADIVEGIEIFCLHINTVLREQPEVNGLLRSVAAVPTAASINFIETLLSNEQQEAEVQSQRYRQYLLVFAVALGALFLYAATNLFRSYSVINRINRKLEEANASLEQRVEERTRELSEAQSALVTSARQAGMAEIANNVLHNVGNVLNSVNVSAELVCGKIRQSKVQGLAKSVQLMNEHASDLGDFLTRDDKGKLLPSYLNKLAATLAAEQQSVLEELGSLTKSIDHIKDIVATQQSYAGATSIVEAVQIHDLLEDALRMNAGALARHQVTVIKEFSDVPTLPLDKPRLLQIMVNLICNAKDAMDGAGNRTHQIILRAGTEGPDSGRHLRIRVEDDGEGIAPENLTRLFVHGFTTRRNGHGFGLHSCALAAKEMGGSLTAYSDGPGKGAIFTLDIPIKRLSE
jgi:two-component system NtrC family sensor kinase